MASSSSRVLRWVPRRSTDAKAGKYSALLKSGQTILPPILSTATVPHQFSCFLKAEKPVDVTLGPLRYGRCARTW